MKAEKLLEEEWEAIKSYLEITREDEERLGQLSEVLQGQHEEILDLFYEHLLSFKETSRFFSSRKDVERVRAKQVEYFKRLTAGNYDLEYLRDRTRVGIAHDHIALPARWYIGAYRKYLELIMSRISRTLSPGDGRLLLGYIESLLKLIFLDMVVAIETYIALREARLQETKEHFRGIFEGANDGIFLIRTDYVIEDANPAALKMLKLDRGDVVGKKCYEIMHRSKTVCGQVPCTIKEVLEKGEVHGAVHKHYDCDGNAITVEISASGVRDSEGNIVKVVESARDITPREEARKELEERLAELERWRKVTVERELRMIELKEENRRLREELDRLKKLCANIEGDE
jgi:PAS domain S-box-containing protein